MVHISILGMCLALSTVLSAQVSHHPVIKAPEFSEPAIFSKSGYAVSDTPGIPTGARGENVTETSFTACWDAVDGADYYSLSVFYQDYEQTPMQTIWIIENQRVDGTSFEVRDVDVLNHTYFFWVQSAKGDVLSEPCLYVPVTPHVEAPIALPATDVNKEMQGTFTANWKEVSFAQYYELWLYKECTAYKPATLDIHNSSFYYYGTDIYNPILSGSSSYTDNGWYVSYAAYADNAMGIDNSNGYGYMLSPEMNFSVGGGKADVKVEWIGDGVTHALVTYATIGETGSIDAVSQNIVDVPDVLSEQTIPIEGGTENGCIFIRPVENGVLMFENMTVSIALEAGDEITVPLNMTSIPGWATSCISPVRVIDPDAGYDIKHYYQIRAIWIGDGLYSEYSDFSNAVYVDFGYGGIKDTYKESKPYAFISGEELVVKNPGKVTIEVYDMAGRTIAKDTSGNEIVRYSLPERGVYIVKAGGEIIKILR